MTRGIQCLILFGIFAVAICDVPENPIRQGKFGFLKGASSMLGSLAQDLVTRSGTSSQVLSLNLTNLFILLVLKAIVFGAGSFGYGAGGYRRSADTSAGQNTTNSINWSEFLSESELLMMLSYMKGDATQDFGCLQRVVCQEPRRAEEYAFTGKLFLKGYELLGGSADPYRYQNALSHIDEAIHNGLNGRNCLEKYRCDVG